MRWSKITRSYSYDEWFNEYVKTALTSRPVGPPPQRQVFGSTKVGWFETKPGYAFIDAAGGSIEDRTLAIAIVREQLRVAGLQQELFSFDWPKHSALRKEADWDDVEAKAKRLRDQGKVQILRNGRTYIVAHVQGDSRPGEPYQVEIMRQDPNSRVITQWSCECPWDQFAFQRTRQWKYLEGRPCAHVLAAYWRAEATPLDDPAEDPAAGQQGQLFGMPGGAAPGGGGASPFMRPRQMMAPPGMQQQMALPGMFPGMATGTPPAPSDPNVIPPSPFPAPPVDPSQVPNPASVPGLRQPSPTNPIQYPGGTFSKVAAVFTNGDMVQTRYDDVGTWVGRMENWDRGEQAHIPRGSVGEVLGSSAGMVNVLFMNPAIGVQEHGNMQPFGATAWYLESELVPRPDMKKPGPAIQRRR
jgi:hypothetical protein